MFVIETDAIGMHLYPGPQSTRTSHFTFHQDPFFGFLFQSHEAGCRFAVQQLGLAAGDDETTAGFRLVELVGAKHAFDLRVADGLPMGEREFVRSENQQPLLLDGLSEAGRQTALLQWWRWLLTYKPVGSYLPYSVYKANSDAMWANFKQLRIALGYNQPANQITLKLPTGKDLDCRQAAEELWRAWPYIVDTTTSMLGQDDLHGRVVDIDDGDWAHDRTHQCLVFQPMSDNRSIVKVTLMRAGFDPLSSICNSVDQLALFLNHPLFGVNHDQA